MLNAIQLFGLILLGGLAAGECARRLLALPRTTGYVVFGLLLGQSGMGWITPQHNESAQLFIDLALGLILFELGYLVPRVSLRTGLRRLSVGLAMSAATGLGIGLLLTHWGYALRDAVFASSLCIATSAAITIATAADVGARGERSGLLYTQVALNGCVAFTLIALLTPFLIDTTPLSLAGRLGAALSTLLASILIGGFCASLVLLGARRLARQVEHQHLLILGTIVLGVGTALQLQISVLLPMLLFGFAVQAFDRDHQVIALRIASDARVFLVITFVLAGAALDIQLLLRYWPEAVAIALIRLGMPLMVGLASAPWLDLRRRDAAFLAIGLQPMSSVALVLLANVQMLYSGLPTDLTGTLLATLLLMQLLGPLCTQTAIAGFGEATRLSPQTPPATHP